MTQAIVALSTVRPVWTRDGIPAFGPDEDPFTLGVDAAQQLPPEPPGPGDGRRVVHLVGEFPPSAAWAFPEALGWDGAEVRMHPASLDGFLAALRHAAADSTSPTGDVVVVVEPGLDGSAGPSKGGPTAASATALRFAASPGVEVIAETVHRSPPTAHRTAGTVSHLLDRLGISNSARAGLRVRWMGSDRPGKVEGADVTVVEPKGSLGRITAFVRAMHHAATVETVGRTYVVAWAEPGTYWAAHLRVGGLVATEPDHPPIVSAGPLTVEGTRETPDESLVSEGAYVPYPRYVEALPSRWRLIADRCGACSRLTFPARGVCRWCGDHASVAPEVLPREGTVEAATVVAAGAQPTEFDWLVRVGGSYQVVLARLHPDARATFQVTDYRGGPLPVGTKVATVLRRLYPMEGEWRYGLKAVEVRPPP